MTDFEKLVQKVEYMDGVLFSADTNYIVNNLFNMWDYLSDQQRYELDRFLKIRHEINVFMDNVR